MTRVALGALLAAAIAATAYRARTLSRSGAIAAFVVGAVVFGAGGWQGAAVLLAFFIPSTALSRVGRAQKKALTDVGKHGPRDAWQVLANGGIAALCVLAATRGGAPWFGAFAGAFAAASADTWGTEVGTLVRGTPVSMLTFKPVATGLSGGITWQGSLATIAGASCVAVVAALTGVAPLWPVVIAGVAGGFADSLLGASLQALRWCPSCARACETDPHVCGTPTQLRRGFSWMDNDAINGCATLTGAIVAGCIVAFAGGMR